MDQDAIFSASMSATFLASPDPEFNSGLNIIDGLKRIVIRGVCLDTSVNRNNWQIPEDELASVAEKSLGSQLRIDHSSSVTSVKGKILKTEVDQPHEETKEPWDLPNQYPHIHYEAELVSNDPNILIPVLQGYVDHVSIGVDSKNVFCSSCGTVTRPGKSCDCEDAWEVVRNARVNEYSIVCSPAYDSAYFKTYDAAEKVTEENATDCDCKNKKDCDKIEKTDRIQEVSSDDVDKDQEVASVESDENLIVASEIIEENEEIIVEKEDGVMVEDETKIDKLLAMFERLEASNTELVASHNELLTRLAAIEAEAEEEEKKASDGGGEKEASDEEASDEEAEEDEGCSKKKATKKKATEVPGARSVSGDKEAPIKKSPIEAGVIINKGITETIPVDSMGLAVKEVFGFAAKLNIFPLE